MRRLFSLLSISAFLLAASSAFGQHVVQSTFFGAGWNTVSPNGNPPQPNPWCPQDSTGAIASLTSFRVWDDGMKWSQIETSASSPTDTSGYSWTKLDYVVNTLATNASCPMAVLYQFGSTPKFASSCSTQADPSPCLPGPTGSGFGGGTQCANPSDYSCLPPMDVNGDGTGADAWWMNFVGNVVSRYVGKIAYYGLWNEQDSNNFWCFAVAACGTPIGNPATTANVPNLKNAVLMAWDAKNLINCIDPAALVISPDGHVASMPRWFHNFINTSITAPARNITVGGHHCTWSSQAVTGKDTFDIVDEHMRGTSTTNTDPTAVIAAYNAAKDEMTTDGLLARPLFNDEWSWNDITTGTGCQIPNVATGAAYFSENIVLQASFSSPSISRQHFYLWDNACVTPLSKTIVGTANDVIAGWLTGATVNNYSLTGSVYSIPGTLRTGGAFKIMFDASKTCSGTTISTCATGSQSAGTFTSYTDISGTPHAVAAGSVPVGATPILLTGATAAAAPTCSVTGGTFTAAQNPTCTSSSGGAVLCYNFAGNPATDGGSACAAGSTKYTGAISIAINETLSIVAGGTGFSDSGITSYTFVFQGAAPTFSPVAGSYASPQTVTISQAQSLARCFTTDGTTPTSNGSGACSHGSLVSGTVSVSTSETLKAIGMASGWTDSAVGSASYSINQATQAAAPTCSPAGGTFATVQNPTCSTTSAGAVQCWTLDGTTPITNGASGCTHGTLYSGAIPVTVNETLMIVAGGTTYVDSLVSSFAFVFHGSMPTFSPVAGSYVGAQSVTITDPQSLSMCYTTDGTSPTSNGLGTACTNGTLYTTAVAIPSSLTLKAIGIKNGWTDSGIGSAAYTISGGVTAATPTFSPVAGTYNANQSVTISTTSAGAILCYTTDGTTPITNGSTGCSNGTHYTVPVTISVNTTLMAVAGGTGFTDSAAGSAVYVLQGSAPTFSPVAGTYTGAQSVLLSQAQSLAMCYTTDGTTPTSNGAGTCAHGTLYSGAISVSASQTLKAIAMKNGWTDSTTGSAAYTINYTLTVAVNGLGSVSSAPSGINVCTAAGGVCASAFNSGSSITLTASPGSGYQFASWTGGGCSSNPVCVVTMSSAVSVSATFSQIIPQVSVGRQGVAF